MFVRLQLAIRQLESALLVVLLAAMIALASAQIVLRNLFDSGIGWSDPLLRLLVLWVGMFGAMIAARRDRHIRIDLLTRYIPQQWHRYTDRITHLFSTLVCALLSWHSGRFVYFEWQDGSTIAADIPAWAAQSILPFGFAIMTLRYLLLTITGREERP
ncbi:MAG: TRAP transporter small permease [Chromatiales bacterium]|nr:TRAP transporter small permease [Chromatiales bacterium]